MNKFREDDEPWYRQFWPWFLISLPATAVVAGFITLNLAINSDDGLVKDDYYKEGLAVSRDAARFEMARQLNVQAAVTVDETAGTIEVALNDAPIGDLPTLTLTFFHPTRSHNDHQVALSRVAVGHYVGQAVALPPANWRLSIDPPEHTWRITGRMPVPQQWTARLN
jgi:hypothetical protein